MPPLILSDIALSNINCNLALHLIEPDSARMTKISEGHAVPEIAVLAVILGPKEWVPRPTGPRHWPVAVMGFQPLRSSA